MVHLLAVINVQSGVGMIKVLLNSPPARYETSWEFDSSAGGGMNILLLPSIFPCSSKLPSPSLHRLFSLRRDSSRGIVIPEYKGVGLQRDGTLVV